jgi:hypothetical protein
LQPFIFAGVIAVVFVAWENYLGETAMVPLEIFKSRSMYVLFSNTRLRLLTVFKIRAGVLLLSYPLLIASILLC